MDNKVTGIRPRGRHLLVFWCWMNSICKKNYDQLFLDICPHHRSGVSSMSKRVWRKIMPAWWMLLDWDCIPTQGPSIFVWKSINSCIKKLNSTLIINPLAWSSHSFIQMNLHVRDQIICDWKNSCMACYSPE